MTGDLIVTATNGVRWKRDHAASSTPAQLFAAMELLTTDWHQRQWNWWGEGQIEAIPRPRRSELRPRRNWRSTSREPPGWPRKSETRTRWRIVTATFRPTAGSGTCRAS
jgi:hypothetical protein